MDTAHRVVAAIEALGVTHVIWLPDSTLGAWEGALAASPRLRLVRVCREGEAWALAAGLELGGARPLVVLQSTGLFESGDSMRNALFDMELPLYAIVGYRSYLLAEKAQAGTLMLRSNDSACRFTEPVLAAWGLDHVLVHGPEELPLLSDHYRKCQAARRAGVTLWAEGKG